MSFLLKFLLLASRVRARHASFVWRLVALRSLPFLTLVLAASLSVPLGASPPTLPRQDSTVLADTLLVPLTVTALQHMTTFWVDFLHDTAYPWHGWENQGHENKDVAFPVALGEAAAQVHHIQVLDMLTTANTYPSVAASLRQAHLTAGQWEQTRRALFAARVTEQLGPVSPPPPVARTVAWKNVAFLRAHPQEVEALLHTGMWLPPITPEATIGHAAPQLVKGAFAVADWLNPTATPQTTFGDGHAYVLVFTAPWCDTCQAVFPVVDTLCTTAAAHGLRVVYGTGRFDAQSKQNDEHYYIQFERLKQYFAELGVTAPVAVFAAPLAMEQSGYFAAGRIQLPTVVVIDGMGTVQDILHGWDAAARQRLMADVATVVSSSAGRSP